MLESADDSPEVKEWVRHEFERALRSGPSSSAANQVAGPCPVHWAGRHRDDITCAWARPAPVGSRDGCPERLLNVGYAASAPIDAPAEYAVHRSQIVTAWLAASAQPTDRGDGSAMT